MLLVVRRLAAQTVKEPFGDSRLLSLLDFRCYIFGIDRLFVVSFRIKHLVPAV